MKFNIRLLCIICLLLCATIKSGDQQQSSFAYKFLIGAVTGTLTTIAVEPLIYVKNTWQQNKPLSTNPRVFYRGLFVNGAGFIPTMALLNSVSGYTEQKLATTPLSFKTKRILAAIASGCASTIPASLRELLIIQQQNNGGSFYHATKNIINRHGYSALLRGWGPVMIRNSIFSGFFFSAIPYFQQRTTRYIDNIALQKITPSILAGSLSAALTHPLDTIKTSMQADLRPTTMIQTARMLYAHKNKGIKNLYRGLSPRIIAIATAMTLEYNIRTYLMELF